MNIKTLITAVLLLFVLGSAAALLFQNGNRGTAAVSIPSQDSGLDTGYRVIAYYFHGTARCVTCRTIEAFAKEAFEFGFANEMQAGHLTWKVVNVEEPENQHFVEDYQLHTKSVVLVERQDGKQTQWKNLDQVWNLVQDKEKFVAYVQEETARMLGNEQ